MPDTPGDLGYSKAQLDYAKIIAGVGTLRGESKNDIVTAIMVALDESSLQNLANPNVPDSMGIPHDGTDTDHASVGLFQQQVGIWGSAQDLMTPSTAAKKFYDALDKAPPGQPWVRAQAVQKSAFPDGSNYEKQYDAAVKIYQATVDPSYVGGQGPAKLNSSGTGPDWAGSLATLGKTLGDPQFWHRAGLFALGALLIVVAVWKFTGAGKYVESAVKSAAKVAAVAA